ncbi:GGDEF domain-containing response regulator [Heliophilum fasciatum]|nr:response regulator [Heliophilum fasciatum]MCW2277171.1 diguanylate cyclase (GGDEF)-like protein [Heliophilum fasciatum]
MKVLIVDDLLNNRILLKSLLKGIEDVEIELADSAAEAFRLMGIVDDHINTEEPLESIDLILMDIMMPEMNGVEACQLLKELPATRHIPIIMVTAKAEMQDLESAFNAGAVDYITKPLRRMELMARVRAALNSKREADKLRRVQAQLRRQIHQLEQDRQASPAIAGGEGASVSSVASGNAMTTQDMNEILLRLLRFGFCTGIEDTSRFAEMIRAEWKIAAKNKALMASVLVEIDNFDEYEQQGGEGAQALVDSLGRIMLEVITGEGESLYPGGPGRMAMILAVTATDDALKKAQMIQKHWRAACEEGTLPETSFTISIGVATVEPTERNLPADLLEICEKALQRAKEEGGDRIKRN